jgi:hypothetical protein
MREERGTHEKTHRQKRGTGHSEIKTHTDRKKRREKRSGTL